MTVKAEVLSCHTIRVSWSEVDPSVQREHIRGSDPTPKFVHAPAVASNSPNDCGRFGNVWTDCTVRCLNLYDYHAHEGSSGQVGPNSCCSNPPTSHSTVHLLIVQDEEQDPNAFANQGPIDMLVPQGKSIGHYRHTEKILQEGSWKLIDTLTLPEGARIRDTAIRLAQNYHHLEELEAVALLESANLLAYEWTPGKPTSPFPLSIQDGHVTGPPAFIQSAQGNFELLVPQGSTINYYTYKVERLSQGGGQLVNALRIHGDTALPTAVALTQSTSGKLSVVARATPLNHTDSDYLAASEFYPPLDSLPPVTPAPLVPILVKNQDNTSRIDNVTGSPVLTQSDRGTFDLLVPRLVDSQNVRICHYAFEGETIEGGEWKFVSELLPQEDTRPVAVSLMQSAQPGHLEAIARVSPPQGHGSDYMVGYVFSPHTGWGSLSISLLMESVFLQVMTRVTRARDSISVSAPCDAR